MKNKMIRATVVILCMSIGNFAYQEFFAEIPNYVTAIERTWFQAFAIMITLAIWTE